MGRIWTATSDNPVPICTLQNKTKIRSLWKVREYFKKIITKHKNVVRARGLLFSSQPLSTGRRGERERASKKMPATATMLGALLGLGTQMYSNALRKLPYMRRTFSHLFTWNPNFIQFSLIPLNSTKWGPWFFWFDLIAADPREHVLGMGLGVVFVNQLVKWDDKLKEDLDKMLEKVKAANERRYFGQFSFFFRLIWSLNTDSKSIPSINTKT